MATVQQERFPEFLRYHLQCDLPRVRSPRLFKLVRDRVRTGEDTFALLDALERRGEVFAALFNPHHEYWIDRRDSAPYVRELNVMRVKQMTPLVFAAWEMFDAADFARVLKLLAAVLFRYSAVSGLNSNTLERVFHEAAKAVLDGTARTVAQVFDRLKEIYVDDERFAQEFARFAPDGAGQGSRLVRYVLGRLEQDASGGVFDPDVDPGTIEHILPVNPAAAWETSIPREAWERAIDRIGNLTWLEAGLNRGIGNAELSEKLVAYASSRYALSKELPAMIGNEWTLDKLEARQQRLARRAVHLWRADFA